MDLFTYLMAKKGHNTHRDLFSYLLGSGNKLPSEYQRLEYIESTGTQYIDTGVNADYKLRVDMDMQYTDDTTATSAIGTLYDDNGNFTRYQWATYTRYIVFYYLNVRNNTINRDLKRHKFVADLINKKLFVDNNEYNINVTPFDTTLNFWLFGRNSNNASLSTRGYQKLYSAELYYNNKLVRNFIPCMRKSDNEIGLYDTVGEQFYTNAGTGKFAYKGYTFVEYIEGTSTQYIDTGVNADDINYSFDIDLYAYETQPTQYPRIFGYQLFGGIFLGNKFWYGNNTDINSTDILVIFNDSRHKIFANKDYAIVDNIKYTLNTPPTSLTKFKYNKIAIFSSFRGDTGAIRTTDFSKIKLYNFKIYHNNNLIRNFIPAIRKSDNVAGLYDLANDIFYENAGTGTFVTPTSQLSSTQSLNTSLLSSNIQEETNIDDIQEEPNLDDVNEIEDIEQNEEPIEKEVS